MIDINTLFGFWPKKKADISLDTLLRLMDEKGIEKAFTLSAKGAFYDFVEGNSETLAACREHPQLIPVGTVNLGRWLGCIDEAKKLIDEGVKLLRFFPQYQEWHITQAPFGKLLDDVLAGSGVGLMIAPGIGHLYLRRWVVGVLLIVVTFAAWLVPVKHVQLIFIIFTPV